MPAQKQEELNYTPQDPIMMMERSDVLDQADPVVDPMKTPPKEAVPGPRRARERRKPSKLTAGLASAIEEQRSEPLGTGLEPEGVPCMIEDDPPGTLPEVVQDEPYGFTDTMSALNNGPRLIAGVGDAQRFGPLNGDEAIIEQATAKAAEHQLKVDEAIQRARGGSGVDHPYHRKRIEKYQKRVDTANAPADAQRFAPTDPPVVRTSVQNTVDAVGAVAAVDTIATGVDNVQSDNLDQQTQGVLQMTAGATDLTGIGMTHAAAAGAPVVAAVATGLGVADMICTNSNDYMQEHDLLNGRSVSDMASEADSLAGVAGRSIAGTGIVLGTGLTELAEDASEATADAVLTYTGQDGPPVDHARPPKTREEQQMVKRAGVRPYSSKAWKDTSDDSTAAIIPDDTGTMIHNYVHPENGPWVDPRAEKWAEEERRRECEELQKSDETYEVVGTRPNGSTYGVSVAPGGKAPFEGDCEPRKR